MLWISLVQNWIRKLLVQPELSFDAAAIHAERLFEPALEFFRACVANHVDDRIAEACIFRLAIFSEVFGPLRPRVHWQWSNADQRRGDRDERGDKGDAGLSRFGRQESGVHFDLRFAQQPVSS